MTSPRMKVKFSTPNLLPKYQSEVVEVQNVFFDTQQIMLICQEKKELSQKNSEESEKFCKKGRDLYYEKAHSHNVKLHHKILGFYSKSILAAPKGTEELITAYQSRLNFLMHLRRYEEALVEIDRALLLKNDSGYKNNLLACKEECLRMLDEAKSTKGLRKLIKAEKKELGKIKSKVMDFKLSATVPFASDCVGLAYNDTFGRHLVAARDIEPAEIIIVEKAYACSPDIDNIELICSHCLEYTWNGIPCDNCAHAMYCSEECKQLSLKEYHDIECPILKYLFPIVFKKEEKGANRLATIRMLIKGIREEGFENILEEISEIRNEDSLSVLLSDGIFKNNFKSCFNLSSVKEDDTEYKNIEINTLRILYLLLQHTDFLASFIEKIPWTDKTSMNLERPVFENDTVTLDPRIVLKLKEALLKLKSVTATNQYSFETKTWQCGYCNSLEEHKIKCKFPRGGVNVTTSSLINHSCTFNLSHLCVAKGQIIVYSICPIKKGEMLCSGYESTSILYGDKNKRDTKLQKFTCKCRACLENISTDSFNSHKKKDLQKFMEEVAQHIRPSMLKVFIETPLDKLEISEEVFRRTIKISKLMYNKFNYYKAFRYNLKIYLYIEKVMAKLYKDKTFMPKEC